MSERFSDASIAEIMGVLQTYFDGLYDGDVEAFARIFHAGAHLYSSDGKSATDWPLETYLEVIRGRPSPASQNLPRYDRVLSIHKAGPDTALATVNCAIPPRYFTDYLTLLRTDAGWQIISKTYHADVHE